MPPSFAWSFMHIIQFLSALIQRALSKQTSVKSCWKSDAMICEVKFFFRCFPTYFCEKPSANIEILKALSHDAIFLATCNAILLLRDVTLWQMFGMLKIYLRTWWKLVFANFISPKSRIALQVARKIAPCDRALRACGYKTSLHVMVTGLMN